MRTRPSSRLHADRGSVLVAVIFGAIILSTLAVGMLDWSLNTLRDAKRKQMRQRLTIEANNEMELVFQKWSSEVAATKPSPLATRLAAMNVTRTIDGEAVSSPLIVTSEASLLSSTQGKFSIADEEALDPNAEGITDLERARRISYSRNRNVVVGRTFADLNMSALGTYEDSSSRLRKKASVGYYRARVRVAQTDPVLGAMEVRLGRRFVFLRSTPFTRAVFYEANMEFGTGSNMDIAGDIQANGSIYIGSQGSAALRISGNVYYYDRYNGNADPSAGIRHVFNGTTADDNTADTWNNPIFDRTLNDSAPADQAAQRLDQVKRLSGKETFVTTADSSPEAIYERWRTASTPPYENVNDVYRAIIAPPPRSGSSLIPEDPTVASNRMYNKASLVIAVEDNDAGTITVKDSAGNAVSGLGSSITSTRSEIYDARENKVVALSTLDVSALKTAIAGNTELAAKYNGVVYVYDKRAATDTTKGYAVRLANAAEVPNFNDLGFVVASDNPVYVQGSFNTTMPTDATELPRCAIMADAVTLLSAEWSDERARAGSVHQINTYTDLDRDPDNGEEYFDADPRIAGSNITINSAIVSGNTPTVSSSQKSGGVQNLVRYLENWSGRSSTINGSLGQMYSSKYFNSYLTRQYQLPAVGSGALHDVGIYVAPTSRYLNFDQRLAEKPPSGTPSSRLSYYRGDLFTW